MCPRWIWGAPKVSLRPKSVSELYKRYSSRYKLHHTTICRRHKWIYGYKIYYRCTTSAIRSRQTCNIGRKMENHKRHVYTTNKMKKTRPEQFQNIIENRRNKVKIDIPNTYINVCSKISVAFHKVNYETTRSNTSYKYCQFCH